MKLREFSIVLIAFLTALSAVGQISITGKVVDNKGNAVQDAEVYLKELRLLETTQADGNFVISNIPGGK